MPATLLGDRVRQAREDYGMSQVELAKRAHISRQMLYLIENNKAADPGVLKVLAIADVLGVSLDALARGQASPAPKRPRPRKAAPVG
jgi:transcriptional regulator with XRE-family HTH domain